MPINFNKKNKKGVALILAILILALVTSATIGVTLVLNRQIVQTTDFVEGAQSFYAADSGAEQILYELRKEGKDVASLTASRNFSNDTRWETSVENGVSDVVLSLAKDETFELSLLDTTDQFTHIDIDTLAFTKLQAPLEITVIAWNINDPRENGLQKLLVSSSNYNLDLAGMSFPSISVSHNNRNYRVRLRALDYSTTFKVAASPGFIPNIIRVKSNGISPYSQPGRHAEQAIELVFSAVSTVPTIFDFVLFSEGDIIK